MTTPRMTVPLEELTLELAGREWKILHTGLRLSLEDEVAYFKVQKLPYGVSLWPSAIALAREMAERADSGHGFTGLSVLELGAGTGFPGMVTAYLGAHVVQTDHQPTALTVCALNAKRNGVEGVECLEVDWADYRDERRYDYIIGADILYADCFHADLRRIFEAQLAPGGHVLIADPMRPQSREFFEDIERRGWQVQAESWEVRLEEAERMIGVFDLQPPGFGH